MSSVAGADVLCLVADGVRITAYEESTVIRPLTNAVGPREATSTQPGSSPHEELHLRLVGSEGASIDFVNELGHGWRCLSFAYRGMRDEASRISSILVNSLLSYREKCVI